MSRNSAGKVYFVLYLAVILELLIIIVERDEAEDHLRKREREAREIVQDILGQMQIGRGDENLNSRITDEISLLSDEAIKISGIPYKKHRTYNIEVGVNDGNASVTLGSDRRDTLEHQRVLKQLANVQDLNYEILYTPSTDDDLPPNSDSSESADKRWKPIATTALTLDTNATQTWQTPVYRGDAGISDVSKYAPPQAVGEPFIFNSSLTDDFVRQNSGKSTKRIFTANFQPTQPGWYKLRFTSKTNRIMGVGGDAKSLDEISDDAKINIGGMQLTVKKLKKLQQMLGRELESFGVPTMEEFVAAQTEDDVQKFFTKVDAAKATIEREKSGNLGLTRDLARKVDVYADITKLLTPNKSKYFAQNHGAMEINVRVTKPPIAIVQAQIALPSEVNMFDKAKPAFKFTAGPFYGNNFPQGEITSADGKVYKLTIEKTGALADNNSLKPLEKGDAVLFMAKTLEPLKPGSYTIRMTHTSQGDSKTEQSPLRVFPSALTKNNYGMVEGRMKSLFYGSTLSLNLQPNCEDRIPANQFRIYAALNNQPQTIFTNGLVAKLPIEAKARTASLRVTWVSPYTDEEIEILPKLENPIKQREPDMDLSRVSITKISGDSEEMTIQISGITVNPATVDVGGKQGGEQDIADVALSQISTDAPGMDVADSRLIPAGGGNYSAVFVLHGVPAKKSVEIVGKLNFTLTSVMRNPTNGTRSNSATWAQEVPFTYTTPAKKGAKK